MLLVNSGTIGPKLSFFVQLSELLLFQTRARVRVRVRIEGMSKNEKSGRAQDTPAARIS